MITLPGSKSITQRALLFASFCSTETRLKNVLESEDTLYLIEALKSVGVQVKKTGKDYLVKGGKWTDSKKPIEFGDNATGFRFFLSACVGANSGRSAPDALRLRLSATKVLAPPAFARSSLRE